jgi:hypothetical protein
MKLFVKGDWEGFFSVFINHLVQFLILVALCQDALGFSAELVYGRILPGVAISFLIGNLFYAWQALRLAKAEGRDDVCAFPTASTPESHRLRLSRDAAREADRHRPGLRSRTHRLASGAPGNSHRASSKR